MDLMLIMAKGFLVVVISLLTNLISVGAQLNLYAAKNDVNSYLKLNFNFDLYLIKNDEPATLLKDPRAFYNFMSPLQTTVKGVKLSWFSSPQSTYYSLKLSSSDLEMMHNPVASIDNKGVVPHSIVSFYTSLDCTGKKQGTVDITMQLNYTKIDGTSINSSSQKSFTIQIKKWCEKTVKDADKSSDSDINHWSRGAIVGLSAGITVFLCLSVGLGLLFKHYMKQRRLKMEFEDDLDLEEKRDFGLKKKVTSLPIHRPSSASTSKPPPVLYSPKRNKLRVARPRQRSETNASDTSTLELICKEESDDESGQRQHSNEGTSTSSREASWRDSLSDILLDPENLEINEYIGKGCLGDLYHGFLKEQQEVKEVYVEVIKDGQEQLLKAVLTAKHLNHPNIIQPIGVVVNTSIQVVVPYMKYSNLDEFLKQNCKNVSNKELLNIALKITEALNYLKCQNHVIKCLSMKECMISEDLDVKVSICYETMDTRWMAPECLSTGLFTEKSEVWSFGVLLWQITAHGEYPYAEIPTEDLLSYLQAGNRLQQSIHCSDELYSLMLKCWSDDPAARPTLHWLVKWLHTYLHSPDTNSSTVC